MSFDDIMQLIVIPLLLLGVIIVGGFVVFQTQNNNELKNYFDDVEIKKTENIV
jgi:uncharacterized membrane protein YdcZ (DUF606 family)